MKKLLLIIVGVMLFSTLSYAENSKTKPVGTLPKVKSLTSLIERSQGKIISIQAADQAKGLLGGFSITDVDGGKKSFVLIPKSLLYTTNSAPAKFSDFKKGDQLTILYVVTLKGSNEVITATKNN